MAASITHAETVGVDRRTILRVLGCMAGLALLLVASSFCSRYARDLLEGLGLPGNLQSFCTCAWYALLAVIAYHRLPFLGNPGIGGSMMGLCVAFGALLASASLLGSPSATVIGVVLYTLVHALATFLLACCLSALPNLRLAAVAVVGGVIARQLALPLYSMPMQPPIAMGIMALLCAASSGLLWFMGSPQIRDLREREALGSLELTNPFSSIWPARRLLVCALLVPLTYSFANVLGVPGLSVRRFAVVLALFALLWYLLVLRSGQEDRLFSLVVFFVMAGLLAAPLVLERDTFVAHTCLFLASSSFGILLWLLIYSLGRRNVASMVPFFAMTMSLRMLGQALGAELAARTIAAPGCDLWTAQAVILGLAFVFFGFIWLGFRGFSFTDAIRGVEPTEALEVDDDAASVGTAGIGAADLDMASVGETGAGGEAGAAGPSGTERGGAGKGDASADTGSESAGAGREADRAAVNASPAAGDSPDAGGSPRRSPAFDVRCRKLARAAELTPRETEIFELLAHGRNARYIMDTLHVTRNTAKAHISHVYTKLGVHSHQELLSLVESGERG